MSLDETDGIVTPEAVLLEFGVAGLATRLFAKLVDLVLMGVLAGIVTLGVYFLSGVIGTTPARILLVVGLFSVIVFVPMLVETFWDGSSPGKSALKLRVVTTDGGPVSLRHAAVRTLIGLMEIPTGLGLLVALAGSRTQRMGDLAAGTFVIKDIATSTEVQPIVFYPPRGLEQFTALLDVSRVTGPQFQMIRSLLLRVSELDSAARYHLSLGVAEAVSTRTTPAPPPGVSPEFYLICIASAYQERNGTLAHQRALRAAGYGG